MPKRVYGYDEEGHYGSVIANALPEGWCASLIPSPPDKPKSRRGRPPKQASQPPIDNGNESLEKEATDDGSSTD